MKGWCEYCECLVTIQPRGMRAGRQRQWHPLPHLQPSGERCPGDTMPIDDHKEPPCCK